MLAHPQGHCGGGGVGVIGRADHHDVDRLLHFAPHFAEIDVRLGLGILLGDRRQVPFVDIADGDHVFQAAGSVQLGFAPPSWPNHGHIEFVAARLGLHIGRHGKSRRSGNGGRSTQKITARHASSQHGWALLGKAGLQGVRVTFTGGKRARPLFTPRLADITYGCGKSSSRG